MILLFLLLAAEPQACRDGAALFEKGQVEPALRALAAAAQAHPESAYCHKALGTAHAAVGDSRGAEAPLARACGLDPAEPDACYYYARALYSLDRFEESLAALARIQPGATKFWRIGTARGQALDALGRAGAESALRQAMAERQRDPAPVHEPDPLLSLAAFLYREGRAADSLELLRAAPAAYQRLATYHYQTGRALAQAEKWAEAVAALNRAVALRERYPEAHGLLSRCYHQLGQAEMAARHTAKAR